MRESAGFPANNITIHIHRRLHVGIHNAVVYPSQKSFCLGVFVNGLQGRWERQSPGGSHNSSGSNRDIRPRVRITITRVFAMF
jgi:hypothetical protein